MRKSNYDKRPVLHVRTKGVSAWQGWEAIGAQLRKAIAGKPDAVVCVDCYHGVWESDVLSALTEQLNPSHVFCTAQATLPKEQVNAMLKDHLTDDRVFGIMAHYRIEQFFDMERVAALRQEIALAHGVRLVFGVGAALLCEHPDVLVYADMARWEIQLTIIDKSTKGIGTVGINPSDFPFNFYLFICCPDDRYQCVHHLPLVLKADILPVIQIPGNAFHLLHRHSVRREFCNLIGNGLPPCVQFLNFAVGIGEQNRACARQRVKQLFNLAFHLRQFQPLCRQLRGDFRRFFPACQRLKIF